MRAAYVARPQSAPKSAPQRKKFERAGLLVRALQTAQAEKIDVTSPPPRTRAHLQMTSSGEAAGVTNQRYWDVAGESWDDIHDTFSTELWGVIRRTLQTYCRSSDQVVDFGCGGGRYVAFIAVRVRHVFGIDISEKLLEIARKEIVLRKRLSNVQLLRHDLGANGVLSRLAALEKPVPTADLGICTNVLLSPEPCTRANILDAAAAYVRTGGKLILLVPAVSSALHIRHQHKRWLQERRRRGFKRNPRIEAPEATCAADERRGVFCRDGVRTQHFKLADIQADLCRHGFQTILKVERVECTHATTPLVELPSLSGGRYLCLRLRSCTERRAAPARFSGADSWDTEFDTPTKFLDRDPSVRKPFDWLIVAERSAPAPPTQPSLKALNTAMRLGSLVSAAPGHRQAPALTKVPNSVTVSAPSPALSVHHRLQATRLQAPDESAANLRRTSGKSQAPGESTVELSRAQLCGASRTAWTAPPRPRSAGAFSNYLSRGRQTTSRHEGPLKAPPRLSSSSTSMVHICDAQSQRDGMGLQTA